MCLSKVSRGYIFLTSGVTKRNHNAHVKKRSNEENWRVVFLEVRHSWPSIYHVLKPEAHRSFTSHVNGIKLKDNLFFSNVEANSVTIHEKAALN